ncbi:MAG: nitrogenase iron-molybdenum cofactor biosynthesis protein NifN [Rubrivivax sp.]
MAHVVERRKACTVNPLKMSAPLGASYAFLGLDRCVPLMHGSQGCTSFGLVLLVRHFKEAIPLQTTAMNEASTILGGDDNLAQALLNIRQRNRPDLIGICSTGLTETKGDDVEAFIRLAQRRHPELRDTPVVYVSTPDYVGAFQDGWAKAVTALVGQVPEVGLERDARRVAVLPGCHLTPGDLDELKALVEAFGLEPVVVPDVSGSLDGHIPDDWRGTTLGGTPIERLRTLGRCAHALAVGEQMRPAALALQQRCGTPFTLLDRLTGLQPVDELLRRLQQLSGHPVPAPLRRQRSQLLDAMLDGHFHFGHVKVAVAAEPDLLWAYGSLLHEMGAELAVAVTTTASPLNERLPTNEVVIGDLDDFERAAQASGCRLLVTHSHGRQAAGRLGLPLVRAGLPLFDRIGNSHRVSIGYRGTMNLIFEIGNLLIDHVPHHGPDDWPLPEASRRAAAGRGAVPAEPRLSAASA